MARQTGQRSLRLGAEALLALPDAPNFYAGFGGEPCLSRCLGLVAGARWRRVRPGAISLTPWLRPDAAW
jgi:hypothetical protein